MNKLIISTPPEDKQCWTLEFIEKIKREHNVIYTPDSCFAIRIIPRKSENPLFKIMVEDDGTLYDKDVLFDAHHVDSLIDVLQKAKEYAKEMR